jgi:hypothetical protein
VKPLVTPSVFEELARMKLEQHFASTLLRKKVRSVNKIFDFASNDNQIVGDAKFFTLVRGANRPPAKFSIIAEHVWLLEKTNATTRFLVFGNDRRVPKLWLEGYGNLVDDVDFYFLDPNTNSLEKLNKGVIHENDK